MTADTVQAAYNPELFNTRSVLRPLSNRETMQRASAVCASQPSLKSLPCTGQIFIGMFFDGTGNNEDADYTKVKNNPAAQKHSNVVRLYHAYPDKITRGTTKYYRYYIPGVGTVFPEIGDEGGRVGTASAWNGEPRLIWGLTRVFNAVSDYVGGGLLIPDTNAKMIANSTGGLGSFAAHREHVFRSFWHDQLRSKVDGAPKNTPKPELINLSVYGFSRGAAEARAFVNWLYAICDEKDGAYRFAGIPLRIQFMGLFDTVASVGVAGAFTGGVLGSEGHQSWASDNMQIHKGVESCLHIVAAHEVRATFPLDSVRIDGIYPPNVKEYVYPGAHSDVGGGYHPTAQGKTDALARIPGFEMYCAAMAAGVPFLNYKELDKPTAQALSASQSAIDIFSSYLSKAKVTSGPVEDMLQQHMSQYLTYRYQARNDSVNNQAGMSYVQRDFFKKATAEQKYLRHTQQHFIAILAAAGAKLDDIMKHEHSYDEFILQPFQEEGYLAMLPTWIRATIAGGRRANVLTDSADNGEVDKLANKVQAKIALWHKWLNDNRSPALADAVAHERNVLGVISSLSDTPLDKSVIAFFDNWVHDSMAGLAHDGVDEFMVNGVGIAKFRRVFFGNNGDAITRERIQKANQRAINAAKAQRQQRKQWDLESAEFARANGR